MSLRGSAFLAIWHDIEAHGELEYNDWHTREHMPERVSVPGFLVGRRYVDWSLPLYRYFTLYEGASLGTFNSPPYLARLNAPTAWTNRIQPHFRNMVRAACTTIVSTGRGTGGALLTARVDFTSAGRDAFTAAARDIADQVGHRRGVTGVHVGVAEPNVTNVQTAEKELRKGAADAVFDGVVLVDGFGRRELEDVRVAVAELLSERVGVARASVGVYDLAYLLTPE